MIGESLSISAILSGEKIDSCGLIFIGIKISILINSLEGTFYGSAQLWHPRWHIPCR
jgi:hypothetical protein